jgi:hypothetical protein
MSLDRAARGIAALGLALLVGAPGCAKDVILPVDQVCGNGKKDGNEECDLASSGCVDCKIVEGWTCTDEACVTTCGDKLKVGEEECDPPDGVTCDSSCHQGAKTEACDMTGYWVARQTDFSIDDVLSQVQTSSNWYVFKISQSADAFQVEQAINCGVKVTGSATVELSESGVRGLMHLNPQGADVPAPRGPRRGTFAAAGSSCMFAMDRHYFVRGGEPRFLPPDFVSKPALASLGDLPSEANPEKPTGASSAGALDIDGDGQLGVAYHISGNASGIRNVIQRDWNEFWTKAGAPIPQQAIEFVANCTFDNQENILHVSHCPVLGCGLLRAGSAPAKNLQDRVTFRYLGKALTDATVARVIVSDLKKSEDDDMQTCANARATLPHDSSSK